MTREKLIEKVARAHARAAGLSVAEVDARWKAYGPAARAAIDIVLEEAAKMAKVAWLDHHFGEIADADLMSGLCEDIERRILALKGE